MTVEKKSEKSLQESLNESVRTTISLNTKVHKWAVELARDKGHGSNFSAYVAELVRLDKEKTEDRAARAKARVAVPVEAVTRHEPTETKKPSKAGRLAKIVRDNPD